MYERANRLFCSCFLHLIYYPCTNLVLPLISNADPESHSGPSSPLPTTVRAFIFIAIKIQHFLPSSTRVELGLLTLLDVLSKNEFKISPQWESNLRINSSSIRG